MRARAPGTVLVVAGAMMILVLAARLVLPGVLDFLLLPVAHLLLAAGVVGLASSGIRDQRVAMPIGVCWGAGWLLLFLREALMLLWILPPEWFRAGDLMIVLGGIAAGVAALLLHEGSRLAVIGVRRWTVLVFAVSSSLFLWFGVGLSQLAPGIPSGVVFGIRSAEEGVLAVATLAVGIRLLAGERGLRPEPVS